MEELIEPEKSRAVDDELEPEEAEPAEAERAPSATRHEIHRVRPSLPRLAAWIVSLAILVVLIVLGARWIYHATHHHAAPAASNSSSSKNQASSQQGKTNGNQPASGSSNRPSSPSSSSPNQQLSNTGPGNTVAIFIAVSLVAAGLHYVISLCRKSA